MKAVSLLSKKKVVGEPGPQLVGQQPHGKQFVGILRAAAVAAIAAVAVLQPTVAPADGSPTRKKLFASVPDSPKTLCS